MRGGWIGHGRSLGGGGRTFGLGRSIYKEPDENQDVKLDWPFAKRVLKYFTPYWKQSLVMHKGKIIETGTHKELIAKDNLYKELYDTQFKHVQNH